MHISTTQVNRANRAKIVDNSPWQDTDAIYEQET